jgi:Pyruvate/2-oxoacid:ferredoxin oxidoreductase gamma subunit
MVALGAFAAATRIVTLESLVDAAHHVLPSYRAQHAEKNARALTAGWELVAEPLVPAWAATRSAR